MIAILIICDTLHNLGGFLRLQSQESCKDDALKKHPTIHGGLSLQCSAVGGSSITHRCHGCLLSKWPSTSICWPCRFRMKDLDVWSCLDRRISVASYIKCVFWRGDSRPRLRRQQKNRSADCGQDFLTRRYVMAVMAFVGPFVWPVDDLPWLFRLPAPVLKVCFRLENLTKQHGSYASLGDHVMPCITRNHGCQPHEYELLYASLCESFNYINMAAWSKVILFCTCNPTWSKGITRSFPALLETRIPICQIWWHST